jgi:hypothetical protein
MARIESRPGPGSDEILDKLVEDTAKLIQTDKLMQAAREDSVARLQRDLAQSSSNTNGDTDPDEPTTPLV